jgi:DNA primase
MAKYLIKAKIEVNGVVEKHDIIGAIFGQTEGLFGEQFDLRALQDKNRIGRIQVNTRIHNGKTIGEIIIPSNLDRLETALVAAMIESVDRVGPYEARIEVVDIIDVRLEKIKKIVNRAIEILRKWSREKAPDIKEILKEMQEALKIPEPQKYGPEQLPSGPDVDKSDTVILVEGRADVINLLRYGIGNVIALGGARKIPNTIRELSKKKKIIAFLDGDHGGDLILKELLRSIKVDYIARAPEGREVEELSGREIKEALSKMVPTREYLEKLAKQGNREAQYLLQVQEKLLQEAIGKPAKPAKPVEAAKPPKEVTEVTEALSIPLKIRDDIKSLYGTLEAILYDENWNPVKRVPVRDLVAVIDELDKGMIYAIVLDGIITQRLLDKASEKGIKILIAAKIGKVTYKPPEILILTFNDIL